MTSSVWCLRPAIENETKATNKVILTTVIIVFVVVFVVVVVFFFLFNKKGNSDEIEKRLQKSIAG